MGQDYRKSTARLSVVENTDEEIQRARLYVCSVATDVADARLLFQVLGLD